MASPNNEKYWNESARLKDKNARRKTRKQTKKAENK